MFVLRSARVLIASGSIAAVGLGCGARAAHQQEQEWIAEAVSAVGGFERAVNECLPGHATELESLVRERMEAHAAANSPDLEDRSSCVVQASMEGALWSHLGCPAEDMSLHHARADATAREIRDCVASPPSPDAERRAEVEMERMRQEMEMMRRANDANRRSPE